MSVKPLFSFAAAIVFGLSFLTIPALARDDDRDTGRYDRERYSHQDNDRRDDNRRWNRDGSWNDRDFRRDDPTRDFVYYPAPVQSRVITRYVTPAPVYYVPAPLYQQRQYYVGQQLDVYYPLTPYLATRLAPVPRGYYYSMNNNNRVFVVSQYDNTIVQIMNLLFQ